MAAGLTPTSETRTYNAVLASTLARRQPGYVNQIMQQIPLFYWLKKAKQYKTAEGPRIEWNVEYALDDSEGSYQGMEVFDIQEKDSVTTAWANWKQYRKSIIISGLDKDVKNTGSGKIFDLLEQKEKNALNSMQSDMNVDAYGAGTDNNSKVITGLRAICVEDATTGTLHGINRANASWWLHSSVDQAGAASWTITGALPLLRDKMNLLHQYCGRLKVGGTKNRFPDLILCTEVAYNHYDSLCSQIGQRFVNQTVADAGFQNLKYKGATMIADEDCPTDTESEHQMFFINSAFMNLFYAAKRNFKVTEMITPADQDAFVAHVLWAGELAVTNCKKQGQLYGISATFAA